MASLKSPPLWLTSAFVTFMIFTLFSPTYALHFYMDKNQKTCFFEELPKDTLIVGHYRAETQNDRQPNSYAIDSSVNVVTTVEEVFDNYHRVVFRRTGPADRFTFTAADSGQHRMCYTVETPSSGGWLASNPLAIKFTLDITNGATSKIESEDQGKIADIVQLVKDLNSRLQDVRREQVFQREREAEFRDQSEATNSRVVRWTLIQIAVLSVTCAWQLSHLRSFFIKQKLT